MELREVEAFLALADELHFGRAADRLGLSQSRVSQLIRRLEARVGGAVFDRTSRRVSLTPLGATLVDELAQPYAGLHQALERARGTARDIQGALRVGFYSTVIGEMLGEPVRRFRAGRPDVDVSLIGTSFGDLTGPLHRGEVDVLATWLPWPEPGLTTGATLAVSDRVLIVADDHPLAGRPTASIDDLAEYGAYELEPPFPQPLRELVLPATAPSGRPIDRAPVDRLTHVLTLLGHGRRVHASVADAARVLARPGLAFVPIPELPALSAGLVWRTAAETATIRAFSDSLSQTGLQNC